MSIYQKHPWIIPIVPFIILFIIVHGIISYLLTMFCPLKVWTSFNRFGSRMVSWLPKEELAREFRHAGFKCLIRKDKSGSLAGYVVLPREHPYYGKGPWDIPESIIAQDGLSFSTPLKKGGDKGEWRVGIHTHEIYKSMDFVVNKIKELAEQLEKRNKAITGIYGYH